VDLKLDFAEKLSKIGFFFRTFVVYLTKFDKILQFFLYN